MTQERRTHERRLTKMQRSAEHEQRERSGRSGRRSPWSRDMEEALIGSMLITVDAVKAAVESGLQPDDFFLTQHGEIFDVCVSLYVDKKPVNPTTVGGVLERLRKLDTVGGMKRLLELHAHAPASVAASHYASEVLNYATARRVIAFASLIEDAAYDMNVDTFADLWTQRDALVLRAGAEKGATHEIGELVESTHDYEWIVPGLIERGEWVVVTGREGGGKTTLIRQFDVMVGAGLHPFTRLDIDPVRVLHIDMQDSKGQCAREFKKLLSIAGDRYTDENVFVNILPTGLNVLDARDREWVARQIDVTKCDILSFGPLYSFFRAPDGMKKHEEEVAERVKETLDGLCEEFGIALLIEAHAPHGNDNDRAGWRPYGASLWQRRPNFGFGISPIEKKNEPVRAVRLHRWRGDRDRERLWPLTLNFGGSGEWPFLAPDEEMF